MPENPPSPHQIEISRPAVHTVADSTSHSLLSDAYGWTKENIAKPFANGVLAPVNEVSAGTNWLAKCANLPEFMPHITEWTTDSVESNSAASYVRDVAGCAGEIAPLVAIAGVAKGWQKYAGESKGLDFLKRTEREEPIKLFTPVENNQIKFNARAHIGGETEGNVFDNGDGTVSKVFHADDHDVKKTVELYQRLNGIGVNVPEVLEYGTTAEGKPAIVMQRIGEGDNLKYQVRVGAVQDSERESLRRQYYALGDKLAENNITIDWNLSNMIFDKNKLFVVDPSWLKEKPMSKVLVNMFAGPIGPR